MATLTIKLLLGTEFRRFSLRGAATFNEVKQVIAQLLNCPSIDTGLQWKDDEGDWISVHSEVEWLAAIEYSKTTKVLMMRVHEAQPRATHARSGFTAPRSSRLSSPHTSLAASYPAVVIGSGYGGSILASRLARAGLKVCVLERGAEKQPGEFPNTMEHVLQELRLTLPDGSVYGKANGFMDWSLFNGTFVWRGNGLGGGSLVNSNVSIKPEPRVFETWPKEFQQNPQPLEEGFSRSYQVLCPNTYPHQDSMPLGKISALKQASQGGPGQFYLAKVNVTFEDRTNEQGVFQAACTLCGDCNTGCNYGSKNMLIMNYLPDAKNNGADLFVNIEVEWVERNSDGSWTLHCNILADDSGNALNPPVPMTISTPLLVLGAGSIGSTEILLRSRAKGLAVSDQLGKHFGADGDFFGLAFNTPQPVNNVGYGDNAVDVMRQKEGPVGPCICSVWDQRLPTQPLKQNFIVEDMAFPGALSKALMQILLATNMFVGYNNPSDKFDQIMRMVQSLIEGPYSGAFRNTLLLGGMSHDNQAGIISLLADRAVINWPNAIEHEQNEMFKRTLATATTRLQGEFVPDPFAQPPIPAILKPFLNLPPMRACVHPIGGCVMSDDAAQGVVNHKGQVYSGTSGSQVYNNLYVVDGAVLPASVGVNPLWTICAVAERTAALMAQDRGLQINYNARAHMTHPSLLKW